MLTLVVVIAIVLSASYLAHYIGLPREARAAATFALPQRRTLDRSRRTHDLVARFLPRDTDLRSRHDEGRVALGTLDVAELERSPLVRQTITGAKIKRLIDLCLAATLIVFTGPIVLAAIAAIRIESPGPVFYRQTRVGHDGKRFRLWKLRTMTVDAEASGAVWARTNDARVTKVGAILRRTRIDEIPQCFNIFHGAMSFVGPRPERPEFTGLLEQEVPHYDRRHLVKPGLTGWAQVNYPYGASVTDAAAKLEYDLYYIQHFSLILDACIVVKTLRVAASGNGSR